MSQVIAAADLSTEIVQNQFRAPLQTAADDSNVPLTDPRASKRDDTDPEIPPFVLPSFPDQDPLYPHLIVSEADDQAERPDQRADLHQHTYGVAVTIYARSTTQLNKLTDGVRDWFEDQIDTLEDNGFTDPMIAGGGDVPTWEDDPMVEQRELRFEGEVYTS